MSTHSTAPPPPRQPNHQLSLHPVASHHPHPKPRLHINPRPPLRKPQPKSNLNPRAWPSPLLQGRTSIFVAHRLSTIKGCDKIVVCKNGLVAEVGSHAELMEAGGLYRAMWERQAAEELAGHQEDGSPLDSMDVASSVEDPDAVMSDLALRTRAAI
eukprot:365630-Chlamydomonas_euryale.AAC.39